MGVSERESGRRDAVLCACATPKHSAHLRELCEIVRDLHLLYTPSIRRQPLVQRDRIPLDILPVRDARRDLPVLLVLAVIFRGGLCMTGAGGDGGPRGMRLCLNLGGSIGSTGASTMRMTRFVAPDAWLEPCDEGVYRMYVGSFLSATALSSEPCADAAFEATICSSAKRVRSEFSAAACSSGLASSSSLKRFSLIASVDECTILPSRWPTAGDRVVAHLAGGVGREREVCCDCLPLRPMSSGYCAT